MGGGEGARKSLIAAVLYDVLRAGLEPVAVAGQRRAGLEKVVAAAQRTDGMHLSNQK